MPFSYEKQGVYKTNSYLVWEKEDGVIVDPPLNMDSMLRTIENRGIQLRAILLTHLHYDHAIGCARWQQRFGLKAYASNEDIAQKESMLARSVIRIGVDVEPFEVTSIDECPCRWGELETTPLFVRGHSPCGICYYFEKQGFILTGDSLFKGVTPRLDLPESLPSLLTPDLKKKVMRLPSETVVFPGHGETTTIGEEFERVFFG